jgi:hypothetical protein
MGNPGLILGDGDRALGKNWQHLKREYSLFLVLIVILWLCTYGRLREGYRELSVPFCNSFDHLIFFKNTTNVFTILLR